MLRSKSPDLVLQEIWGHLCCHYAIRTLMTDAARHAGHDPDRVSFIAALRIARRSIAQRGAFPPLTSRHPDHGWHAFLSRVLRRLNPADAPRTPASSNARCPNGTSNESHHTTWPQPQHATDLHHPPT